MVQDALLSFALDSAAHIIPGYCDETVRALHATARIMAEGHIPGSTFSWIASASLAALKKKNGSQTPSGDWRSLRRLTDAF